MILPQLEQGTLYSAINFSMQITGAASVTARRTVIFVYLCPSSSGSGPVRLKDAEKGPVVISDVAPGQYLASAGQGEIEDVPGSNNGVFYRNSRVPLHDLSDGTGQTLMLGERSRNLCGATWVGAIPSLIVCTNPTWKIRDCATSNVMVLANSAAPGLNRGSTFPTTRRPRQTTTGACTPAGATSSSATARSGSSKSRSTPQYSAPWPLARGGRWSARISSDARKRSSRSQPTVRVPEASPSPRPC